MDVTLHDLALYFTAATGAMPPDGSGMYLVSEEDGDLIEKLWTGHEVREQVFIAADVKESTPAVYLLDEDSRRIFCLDAEHNLQCYEYDADEEEWNFVLLRDGESIPVHPKSRLSGCLLEDTQIVVFQDPSGRLRGMRVQPGGEVESLTPTSISSSSAIPHTAFVGDDESLHLLYIDSNNQVHHLTLSGNQWKDTIIPGAGFVNDKIIKLMVTGNDENALNILALSSTGQVLWINPEGQKAVLGKVERERFVAASSEECAVQFLVTMSKMFGKAIKKRKEGKDKMRK
ncbi:hypothetical protein ASPWEDRAFT_30884 [Aspergillus wentii DTO 134E9]|uniref:SMP-30/Gluconolactonase/LRE-like region domain-containing protein n=1 Tax=Aspergillus wentii DTO 134E9 TaxID=1073089 RepID=A0A1L9RAH8_ASPWE|nr:uncharacterized protein ASPWEDRAFT_30884 [Aspergillus wentii DTO 134E9]KAI9934519.1 hypothetical protein MW887_000133 [Aspergillus wentii]OJJ31935.1 hypothetical protein ASPWEDRAFT_30884 [Aspergillus wentii DTO 134E9]